MSMKPIRYIQILLCSLLTSCFVTQTHRNLASSQLFETKFEELTLFDSLRSRPVPVALYFPGNTKIINRQKVIIISHGYNANTGKSNLGYSYISQYLASKGYFVASIQHELPTDSLLPLTGIPQIVRKTNWERGVKNILFVRNELKKRRPGLDYKHLILIGHSNGGDMTMLFAQKYPDLVSKAISLDNRRVNLPRTKHPRIYSLRSSDQPADKNVLPTPAEQDKYGIKIIKLPDTPHTAMSDDGNQQQKEEINKYILGFLNDD